MRLRHTFKMKLVIMIRNFSGMDSDVLNKKSLFIILYFSKKGPLSSGVKVGRGVGN